MFMVISGSWYRSRKKCIYV